MKRSAVCMLAAAMVLASACGTRLPDSAFAPASDTRAAGAASAGAARDDGDTDGDSTPTTIDDDALAPSAVFGSTGDDDSDLPDGAVGAQRDDGGPNTASEVGITETTITLGNITAENGVLGDAFAPAVRGLRAWVAATNAQGGIRGRKVVLKTCDDREDRNRNLACAQQLVERDKVFALVATNTRSLGGSAQYLADRAVPVIGFPINNSFYRYPNFFSSYRANDHRTGAPVRNLITTSGYFRWFRQNLKVSKVAVFSYDIDESKQAGTLFKKGLELEGFKVFPYVVSFAAPSFDQAVADMQREGVEMIVDSMDDGAMRKLCDAMARRQFTVKAKVGTIVALGDFVGTTYNSTCRKIAYAVGFSRNYDQVDVPEIARFREAYRRYQPNLPLHQWALEAWGLGGLTGVYLDTASPTRKGFVAFLNNLRDYRANGVHTGLDWEKADQNAPRVRDCFTVAHWSDANDGWIDATGSYPFCYPDAFQYQSPALEQGN